MPVEFYIESPSMAKVSIIRTSDKKEILCQISSHPRGVLISFVDIFFSKEIKEYEYKELHKRGTFMSFRSIASYVILEQNAFKTL